ncbi:FlgO family outer membrane protein [Desulfomarina sp.]
MKYIRANIFNSGSHFCRQWFFFSLTLVSLIITGCSSFNGTPLEKYLGADTNLITFSYTIADNLVQRATPPLVPHHPDMPVLVTTVVDNNNLGRTSRFGRILQEHIASRLVQLGYSVKEIKLANTLKIIPGSGETILTRDLSLLEGSSTAQAIFVGTFSYTRTTMYLSVRLINPVNSNIIATDDYQLTMDDNILAMFGLQRLDSRDDTIKEPPRPFLNSVFN